MSSNYDNEKKMSIKMFGFFDVCYKGRSIFLEMTSSVKSIEILRFMLSQKNKLFISETIAENVWPENEYLDEKKVIRTYIHRLRKILNIENSFKKDFSDDIRILNVKGSYMLETSENVVIDTELFEAVKNSVMDENRTDKLLEIFEYLLSLYTGEFLEECRNDHWVLMLRNYYLRLFCSTINLILTKLGENGAFKEIIEVCEKSLKIYDLDEGMNIAFITALVESDQITNALQHYNFITSKMYNELSVTPSEKMRRLYNSIKSKKAPLETGEVVSAPELIDSNTLILMIDEAIKKQLAPKQSRFSIGYIKIIPNNLAKSMDRNETEMTPENSKNDAEYVGTEHTETDVRKSLKQAIEYALRKNDMYAITDDSSALLVLSEATEDSYPVIANRISQSFYSRHDGFDSKLQIKIYPSIRIM